LWEVTLELHVQGTGDIAVGYVNVRAGPVQNLSRIVSVCDVTVPLVMMMMMMTERPVVMHCAVAACRTMESQRHICSLLLVASVKLNFKM
jgi:hypothetical protein